MTIPILPCQVEFLHRHGIRFRTAITEGGHAEWVLLVDIADTFGMTLHELERFMASGLMCFNVTPLEIFVYHVNLGVKLALDMGSGKQVIDALNYHLPGGKEQ